MDHYPPEPLLTDHPADPPAGPFTDGVVLDVNAYDGLAFVVKPVVGGAVPTGVGIDLTDQYLANLTGSDLPSAWDQRSYEIPLVVTGDTPVTLRVPVVAPFVRVYFHRKGAGATPELDVIPFHGDGFGAIPGVVLGGVAYGGVLMADSDNVGAGASVMNDLPFYYGPAVLSAASANSAVNSMAFVEWEVGMGTGTWRQVAVSRPENVHWNPVVPFTMPARRCRLRRTNFTGAALVIEATVVATPRHAGGA